MYELRREGLRTSVVPDPAITGGATVMGTPEIVSVVVELRVTVIE